MKPAVPKQTFFSQCSLLGLGKYEVTRSNPEVTRMLASLSERRPIDRKVSPDPERGPWHGSRSSYLMEDLRMQIP